MNQNNEVKSTRLSSVFDENSVLRLNKKVKKWPFVLLMLLSFIILGFGIYLFLLSKNKYDSYVITGADLVNTNKVYEAGVPYNVGRYQYTVKHVKYYYDYEKKFEGDPDQVIQIRYNPKNPKEIYDEKEGTFFIIVISVGVVLLILSIGLVISISSKNAEKIVIVVVDDIQNCVGGRKIYMRTLNINGRDLTNEKMEYFSYFTNQLQYFPIGKKIKFNAFKYSEALATEKYKNCVCYTINEFKITDFIFIN